MFYNFCLKKFIIYFIGARGINQKLEEQLDDIYANGVFVLQGEEYKCHP